MTIYLLLVRIGIQGLCQLFNIKLTSSYSHCCIRSSCKRLASPARTTKKKKNLLTIQKSNSESYFGTYHTHLLGFGTKGSFKNFLNISVHFSPISSRGNVSIYSASLPLIHPNIKVSEIFENE